MDVDDPPFLTPPGSPSPLRRTSRPASIMTPPSPMWPTNATQTTSSSRTSLASISQTSTDDYNEHGDSRSTNPQQRQILSDIDGLPSIPSGPATASSSPRTRTLVFEGDQQQTHRSRLPPLGVMPTSSSLLNNSPAPGGYGTIRSPARSRSRESNGQHWGAREGNEVAEPFIEGSGRASTQAWLRRRLENTASMVGIRKAMSYDDGFQNIDNEDGGKVNGTRLWYSSFVSIDWIHDAIKDSSRLRRIRSQARGSLRGQIFLALDRAQGWIVCTLVGFLTALVAFAIVRGEGWAFDLKEGYCAKLNGGWRLSRGFCCRGVEGVVGKAEDAFFSTAVSAFGSASAEMIHEETCSDWRTWESVLGPWLERPMSNRWIPFERYMVEYLVYILVAVSLAFVSSLMTVKLTRSTDFETKKNAAVDANGWAASGTARSVAKPRKVMYFAGGSGIPEIKTILSGFVIHGYLGGWTLLTKTVGLTLSVASGLSLGKEGPMVHIASCIGNLVSRRFVKYETNEAKRREVLSAAAAAGVAVAFGAPIGGVLFSLEEVSTFFPAKVMWRSFWTALVAVTTLKVLDPFGSGKIVLFQVTYDKDWRFWELVPFLLIGCLMGFYGAIFARLNILWSRHVRGGTWLKRHPITEVVLVTIVTALLSFLNPYTRMGGTELVLALLSECTPDSESHLCVSNPSEIGGVIGSILLAMLVKAGLTIITFGIKLPAGVFVPTLAVGACTGRMVGLLLQYLEAVYPRGALFDSCQRHGDCVVPGVYALVGAGAALAGVTRTTVSLAVIVCELTGTLTYAVPTILGVLVAKTIADALEPKGIYDLVIELNELPYLDGKENHLWGHLQVADAAEASADVIRCDRPNTVASLAAKLDRILEGGGHDGAFPVVEKEETTGGLRLRGVVSVNELEHALADLSSNPTTVCKLQPPHRDEQRKSSRFSIASFGETTEGDPFNLVPYIDQAPITVQLQSPLELVQQLFIRLGSRQVVVLNAQGYYAGIITRSQWLTFIAEIAQEEGH